MNINVNKHIILFIVDCGCCLYMWSNGKGGWERGNAIFHSQQFSSSHSWQSMAADFLDLDEDNNGRDMSHLLLVIFLLLYYTVLPTQNEAVKTT